MYEKTKLAAKVLKVHKKSGNKKKGVAQAQKLKEAMMHEVNMLSRLQHPYVVKLVGACSVGNDLCLCTEFSDLGSLAPFIHVEKQPYSLGVRLYFSVFI